MKSYLASLVVAAFVAVPSVAAPGGGLVRADVSAPAASGPQSGSLLVVVHCEACEPGAEPAIAFLWRRTPGAPEPTLRGVRTVDWSSGAFELVDSSGNTPVQATQVAGGWAIEVALPGGSLPFRTQAVLRGFTARRGVYWPGSDATPRNDFHFEPVAEILARHPTWDPAQGDECEVMIPKSATMPVTFVAAGEPRAWLFPALKAEGADSDGWTFQFAKPGQSVLERMEADVSPVDEGDSWTFRLPLAGVLGGTAPSVGIQRSSQGENVAAVEVLPDSLRAKTPAPAAGDEAIRNVTENVPPALRVLDGRGTAGATIDVSGCQLTLP